MVAPATLNYNYGELLPMHKGREKLGQFVRICAFFQHANHAAVAPKTAQSVDCGFTRIELLIVMIIVMIGGVIAVPSLLDSRLAANEAAAISSIQNINRAQVAYQAAYPTRGFAATLADLGGAKPCTPGPSSACLIDAHLGEGVMSGHNFVVIGTKHATNGVYQDYTAGAAPATYGQTGVRLFCSTSDGILRYSANPRHSSTPPNTTECLAETPLE
jgi:type II secretory pathway pseudopilin PulG